MGDVIDSTLEVDRFSPENLGYVLPEESYTYILIPANHAELIYSYLPNDGYFYAINEYAFMPFGHYGTPGRAGPIRWFGGYSLEQSPINQIWLFERVTELGEIVQPCSIAPLVITYPCSIWLMVVNDSDQDLFTFCSVLYYKYAKG